MSEIKRPSGSVFISYARENKDISRRLDRDLKMRQIDVWLDKESLLAGGFRLCHPQCHRILPLFLLILSESSVNKTGYIIKEIRKAIDVFDTFPEGARFIIPVRKK